MLTKIELPLCDVRSLLELIRVRQDDCRKITHESPNYEIYHGLDIKLEKIKMEIAKQI